MTTPRRQSTSTPGASPKSPNSTSGEAPSSGANVIGAYELRTSLGRGGMAEVFLAVHQGNLGIKKLVVVKKLRTDDEASPEFVQMFLDEARLASRINHPNVVATYDVGHENGVLFIAMEYLEGQSLHAIQLAARSGRASVSHQMSARLVAEVLGGLHHAHELRDFDGKPLRLVHRDVSPHNIFVTYGGGVKLLDFGVAKATVTQETQGDGLKGKIGYMAPEYAMGQAIDRRADVFAAGIVLWEMLAGRYLMTDGLDDNAVTTLMRLLNDPVPLVSTVDPTIDPKLDAIVAKALSRQLTDRFQSAQEMRDALDAYVVGSPSPVGEADITRWMRGTFAKDYALVGPRNMAAMSSTATVSPSFGSLSESAVSVVMQPDEPRRAARSTRRHATVLACFLAVAGLVGAIAFTMARRPFSHTARATSALAPPPLLAPSPPAPIVPAPRPMATVGVAAASPAKAPAAAMALNPSPLRRMAKLDPAPKTSLSAEATPVAVSAAGTGFLTINTHPWTHVFMGGKDIGTTPVLKLELPVGNHVLTFKNPDKNLERTETIAVVKGATLTKHFAYE